MNHLQSVPATYTGPGKRLDVALWAAQVLLALTFLAAASGKLLGNPEMVAVFEAVGVGQWFRYATGLIEIAGALLVVVPKTRVVGAGLFVNVMVGAAATHLFVLHNAPTAPLVLLALASFVLWGRRAEIARLLGR
jgi:uncharacterized membrane protein YphA (DoxX/SURF4 family)